MARYRVLLLLLAPRWHRDFARGVRRMQTMRICFLMSIIF